MTACPLIDAAEEMIVELQQAVAGEVQFDWLTRRIFRTESATSAARFGQCIPLIRLINLQRIL